MPVLMPSFHRKGGVIQKKSIKMYDLFIAGFEINYCLIQRLCGTLDLIPKIKTNIDQATDECG